MKFIALAFVLLAPMQFAAAADISIESFLKPALADSATLSPDGKFIAFSVPREDRDSLVVLDRESREVTGHMQFGRDAYIYELTWATAVMPRFGALRVKPSCTSARSASLASTTWN